MEIIITIILAIAAIVIPLYYTKYFGKLKSIQLYQTEIHKHVTIPDDIANEVKLEIFDKFKSQGVYYSTIIIKNISNYIFDAKVDKTNGEGDFHSITIQASDKADFLECKLLDQSNDNSATNLKRLSNKEWKINFQYLGPEDSISLKIVTGGAKPSYISQVGRISGTKSTKILYIPMISKIEDNIRQSFKILVNTFRGLFFILGIGVILAPIFSYYNYFRHDFSQLKFIRFEPLGEKGKLVLGTAGLDYTSPRILMKYHMVNIKTIITQFIPDSVTISIIPQISNLNSIAPSIMNAIKWKDNKIDSIQVRISKDFDLDQLIQFWLSDLNIKVSKVLNLRNACEDPVTNEYRFASANSFKFYETVYGKPTFVVHDSLEIEDIRVHYYTWFTDNSKINFIKLKLFLPDIYIFLEVYINVFFIIIFLLSVLLAYFKFWTYSKLLPISMHEEIFNDVIKYRSKNSIWSKIPGDFTYRFYLHFKRKGII